MSILIEGMEMPKNCIECPCGYDTEGAFWDWCSVLAREYEKDADSVRPDWCPLVELPPHGRLIDADAIQDYNVETFGQRLLIIDTAPTVIEAEGSEE